MKYLCVLIICLIAMPFTYSAARQYATLTLTVLNRPPEIRSIGIIPQEAYSDSVLECTTEVFDEHPDKVKVHHNWYRNGEHVSNSKTLSGFDAGDEVRCEATPVDIEGVAGDPKSFSIIIQETPAAVRVVQPILRMAGIERDAAELTTGMQSITGMVTGGSSTTPLVLSLAIFAMILVSINLIRLQKRLTTQ